MLNRGIALLWLLVLIVAITILRHETLGIATFSGTMCETNGGGIFGCLFAVFLDHIVKSTLACTLLAVLAYFSGAATFSWLLRILVHALLLGGAVDGVCDGDGTALDVTSLRSQSPEKLFSRACEVDNVTGTVTPLSCSSSIVTSMPIATL